MKESRFLPRKFVVVLLCILLKAAVVAAQVSGNISTTGSQPVPSATIRILNTGKSAVADESGHFLLPALTAGRYQLEISAAGFATAQRELLIGSGATENISIVLNDARTRLDEVIVSAQKQEEFIQRVPLSISSISARQVQEYRLWNNKDITAIVPNLYASDPGDHRNVTSIRGITTTSYVPAVATYIDGVNQFALDTYIPALIDVERIEVLRGPQGTLYGRNAMGGVINIITRQPSNKPSAVAQVDIGNYGQQRYTAGFRTPLLKDKLYLGVAAIFNKREGFYRNEFNNTPYENQQSFTGNYYLKYLAGKNWVINANLKHHDNRNHGPFPLVGGPDEDAKRQYVLSQNALTTMVDNTQNASISASYSGPGFNFSSQTAYQKNYRYYKGPLDGDFSPLDAVSVLNNYGKDWNNVKAVTEEFKFSSPASSESDFKWTAGSYLFYQDNPARQGIRYGMDAPLIGVPDSLFTTVNTTQTKSRGAAVFGQGSYRLSEKFELTAGIRYDYEHQEQHVSGTYQHDPDPDFVTTVADTAANASFNAFSPKLALNYQVTSRSIIFASYSRGFRAGGLTPLSSDPSQPPLYVFKPEYSSNFEAGIKNDLFHKTTRFNLYFFYNKITNAQVPTLILPDGVTITRNTGELENKGVEAELFTQPIAGLELGYNFGYTHSRFKSLKISQNGGTVDLAGKRQLFTPDITSMLSLQYSYPLGTKQQLRALARGEWRYLGTTFFDYANTIRQSPASICNLRIGIAAKNFELMFWERNAGAKKYISYAYDFGAVRLGDPRTYGVTLMVKLD